MTALHWARYNPQPSTLNSLSLSLSHTLSLRWDDQVQGHIEFPNKDIDDFIILRADGSPTYLLAVYTPPFPNLKP